MENIPKHFNIKLVLVPEKPQRISNYMKMHLFPPQETFFFLELKPGLL